jgi:hypothetical protein
MFGKKVSVSWQYFVGKNPSSWQVEGKAHDKVLQVHGWMSIMGSALQRSCAFFKVPFQV